MNKWVRWIVVVACSFLPAAAIYLFLWPPPANVSGLVDVAPPLIPEITSHVTAVNGECLRAVSANLGSEKLTFVVHNTCRSELAAPFYVFRFTSYGVAVSGNRYWFDGDKVIMPGERRFQYVTVPPAITLDGAQLWFMDGVR